MNSAEVYREWIVRRRWSWLGAHRGNIARPMNRKRLRAPDFLDQRRVFALRCFPKHTCLIGICHLHGIHRWSFRLFCRWIAEADSRGAHIPEIAAIETPLRRVVVQDPRIGGVRITLGFSWSEAVVRLWRSGVGDGNAASLSNGCCIEQARCARETGIWHVASGAGNVLLWGEVLIVNLGLSEQRDLVIHVQRR